jgi:hypothetical protein
MKRIYLAVFALLLGGVLVLAGCATQQEQLQGTQTYPYGYGSGSPMGSGMMGTGSSMGPSGMMGSGIMGSAGMMGGISAYSPDAEQIAIDDAAEAAERYLSAYYGKNLVLKEVMDFAWNFYAEVEEQDTGIHAMELIIDKYSGQVSPEMGPNMMWNTKYSMMGSHFVSTIPDMTVSPEEAREIAQKFLDNNLPEYTVGEADTFYGYYTLHTLKDGHIEGMLSVNGYEGTVWYHNWHGSFVGMKESEEH